MEPMEKQGYICSALILPTIVLLLCYNVSNLCSHNSYICIGIMCDAFSSTDTRHYIAMYIYIAVEDKSKEPNAGM